MARLWKLTDPTLPEEFNTIKKVFIGTQDRRSNESLHDYLTRKKIKCFCPKCRRQQERDQNTELL